MCVCVHLSRIPCFSLSLSVSLFAPSSLSLSFPFPPPPFPSCSQARAEVFTQVAAQGPFKSVLPSPNDCDWQDQAKWKQPLGFSGALAPGLEGRAFQSLARPRSEWKGDLSDRWGQRDPRLLQSAPGEEKGRGILQHLVTDGFKPRWQHWCPQRSPPSCPSRPLPAVLPLRPLGSDLTPILPPPPPRRVTLSESWTSSNLSFFVWRMEVMRSEVQL